MNYLVRLIEVQIKKKKKNLQNIYLIIEVSKAFSFGHEIQVCIICNCFYYFNLIKLMMQFICINMLNNTTAKSQIKLETNIKISSHPKKKKFKSL